MAISRPGSLKVTLLVIAWVLTGLTTIVVALRLYVRLKLVKKFTIDDALVIVALALGIINSIFLTISSSWGLGAHEDALSKQQIMHTIKWVHLREPLAVLSPCIGRIAYAVLLLNLLPPNRWRSRLLWGVICIEALVDCASMALILAQCQPVRKYWDTEVPGKCWPSITQRNGAYFQASASIMVDFTLAVFPAGIFWNLNMERRKKISLICSMGLGIFAMIASIVKATRLKAYVERRDFTFVMARLTIWWTVEGFFVILAASIPTLRPIMTVPRKWAGECINAKENITRSLSQLRHAHKEHGEAHSLEDADDKGVWIKKSTTIGITYETNNGSELPKHSCRFSMGCK